MTDPRRENSKTAAERDTGSPSHRPTAANQTKGELDAASEHLKERGPDDLPNIEAAKEAVLCTMTPSSCKATLKTRTSARLHREPANSREIASGRLSPHPRQK